MPGKCAWVCATWTSWTSPRACLGSSGKGAQARQADSHRRGSGEWSTQVHMIQQLEEQAWVSQALNTHWYINHIYLSWAPWYLSIWRRLYSTEVLISLLIVEICFAFISSDRSSLVSTYISNSRPISSVTQITRDHIFSINSTQYHANFTRVTRIHQYQIRFWQRVKLCLKSKRGTKSAKKVASRATLRF